MRRSLAHAEISADESALATAFAPSSRGAFVEAWYRRVREVDDATMENLVRLLLRVRRIKHALAAVGFVGGGMLFGLLPTGNPLYTLLIYTTMACMVGVPTLATGTLAVRRIFLKEARRLGLSQSTAMLLLTRAERRARFQRPFQTVDNRVEQLVAAIRDWDEA